MIVFNQYERSFDRKNKTGANRTNGYKNGSIAWSVVENIFGLINSCLFYLGVLI